MTLNLCASVTANAHSPYLDQKGLRTWLADDGRRYQIGMLYGDGIFGPDPGRAVVLNDRAEIVAVGPRSNDGYVRCPSERECYVILSELPFSKAVPNFGAFKQGRIANFYPEHEKELYGFEHQRLSPADYFVAMTVPFRRSGEGGTLFSVAAVLVTVLYWFASRAVKWVSSRWPHKFWIVIFAWVFYLLLLAFMVLASLGFAFASSNGFYWVHAAGVVALTYLFLSRYSKRFLRPIAPARSKQ